MSPDELAQELAELRQDRSRWVARCLDAERSLARARHDYEQLAGAFRLPMPFIVGAPRSGTTLLRFMLDSHPLMAIPPETGFLSQAPEMPPEGDAAREAMFRLFTSFPPDAPRWADFGLDAAGLQSELESIQPFDLPNGFRAFYRLYAVRQNKPRYGDKTAFYTKYIGVIRQVLPEARFIHIIRDGRDCSLSLRGARFAPADRRISTLAKSWRLLVSTARASGKDRGDYMEVLYEDLVRDPEPVLRKVCAFVDLGFDPAMLRYFERTPERLKEHTDRLSPAGELLVTHEQRLQPHLLTLQPPREDRIFRWKEEMTLAERAEFREAAGDLLEELGYEL